MAACAAALAALPVLAAAPALGDGSQDVLRSAGIQADRFVELWRWTLAVTAVAFGAVLVALVFALARAPRGDERTAPDAGASDRPERGAVRAVAAATGVSVLLLVGLLVAAVLAERAMATLGGRDEVHVQVTAHQFWWDLRYDDDEVSKRFTTANELHVPVGRPVRLSLQSDDVIHSLWVPNLGGKRDLIPGRPTDLVLRADRPGVYRGQCAEFCGLQHAKMALVVVAHAPADYARWAETQRRPAPPPAGAQLERGRRLFVDGPCAVCHAVQGTNAGGRRAPDLTHLASRSTLAAGTLPNDAASLAAWITDPQALKPGANMPGHAYAPEDLAALVAWLRSLR